MIAPLRPSSAEAMLPESKRLDRVIGCVSLRICRVIKFLPGCVLSIEIIQNQRLCCSIKSLVIYIKYIESILLSVDAAALLF